MGDMREKDPKQTKVLVADDQMLYREGLIGLMRHWSDFQVVGEASNGREAVAFCKKTAPDMVLMDVQMPIMNGIDAAKSIHRDHPDVLIVMLTVSSDEEHLLDAFVNGASGYVLKDLPSSQLHACLQAAVRGDPVLSGAAAETVIKRALDVSSRHSENKGSGGGYLHVDLTEREIEILRLVANGLSNDEIATQMYLSPSTVKKNLQLLMQKVQVSNRVMLAVYAFKAGLIE